MKEQLRRLRELQKVDSRILEVRRSIEALPAKLAPVKADLAKLQGLLDDESEKIAETEKWRKEQEDLIKREEEAVKSAKNKLQASKNARDYSAANREIEFKRRSISEREDEVLKVFEAMEQSKKKIEAQEGDVAKLREHVEKEEASLQGELSKLETEAQEAETGRADISKEIQPQLLRRYEHALKSRGVAIVAVVGGTCQGCHMKLPPQLANVIARLESVETCPQCYRLLYRKELFEEEETEEATAQAAES